MDSAGARQKLIEALRLDLVGPDNGSALEWEILPQSPSHWYLAGFLVPVEAPLEKRIDETADEQMDLVPEPTTSAADDAAAPEPAPARKAVLPSSMGLSFMVPATAETIEVAVRWGEYEATRRAEASGEPPAGTPGTLAPAEGDPSLAGSEGPMETGDAGEGEGRIRGWQRVPQDRTVTVGLPKATEQPLEVPVPDSRGLLLSVTVRPVNVPAGAAGLVPAGSRSVSVFLVNQRPVHYGPRHEGWIFQARLEVSGADGFVARPDFRGLLASDFDERVADFQYRDDCEMVVGHGIAAEAVLDADSRCRRVRTEWIPEGPVEWVAPAEIPGVELGMEALAAEEDAGVLRNHLMPLVDQYRSWIAGQGKVLASLPPRRGETAL